MWVSNDGEVPPGWSEAPCSRWYGHLFGSKSWRRHRADLGGAEIQEVLRGSRPEAWAGRGEQDRAEAVVKSARGDPKFREDELITSPERSPLRSEGEHGAFLASYAVLQFHAARKTSCPVGGAVPRPWRSAAGARFSMVVR